MRNLLRLAWMVLLLLIVALASALVTMRLAIHGREVQIPDFRGKTPAEARQIAEAAGLDSQIERQFYSPTVPEGRVLSQMPEPGTTVRHGWQIRLAVSLGPQRVSIPQVVGQSERAAAITLEQRGLELGASAHLHSPDAPVGYVIGQDPPHDATGVSAPKVNLLVADGPTPQEYVTPSFAGQSLGTVTNTLRDAGFSVGKVTLAQQAPIETPAAPQSSASPPSLPTGANVGSTAQEPAPAPLNPLSSAPISPASIVVSQDPAPGQKITAGSSLNLVVR